MTSCTYISPNEFAPLSLSISINQAAAPLRAGQGGLRGADERLGHAIQLSATAVRFSSSYPENPSSCLFVCPVLTPLCRSEINRSLQNPPCIIHLRAPYHVVILSYFCPSTHLDAAMILSDLTFIDGAFPSQSCTLPWLYAARSQAQTRTRTRQTKG